jgi:23S rRNA (cytosine1962-C5)-methyltransferase
MGVTLQEILKNAWERRSGLRRRTQAYRLLNGAASGTPGLAVDVFGDWLVAYAYGEDWKGSLEEAADALRSVTGAKGAALIDRAAPDESGREPPGEGKALYGDLPEFVEVSEGEKLRFGIHLRHPRNVGLFLDTRPLRETLLSTCAGAEVLNLFSYSCSLGVAAAAGGAAGVANVDISARYLGWGRENFALSGLPPEHARFNRMDSEEYLDWAGRKGKSFDVIILDPPSFSRASPRGRGPVKTWSFEKDYFRLLGKCAGRLRPGGRVYAVTNYGGITAARFRKGVEETLASAGRRNPVLRPLGLPEDFDPGPEGQAAQAVREGAFLAIEARIP